MSVVSFYSRHVEWERAYHSEEYYDRFMNQARASLPGSYWNVFDAVFDGVCKQRQRLLQNMQMSQW